MQTRHFNRAAFDTDLPSWGSVSTCLPVSEPAPVETVSQRYIREAKARLESDAQTRAVKVEAPRGTTPTRYTTDYAVRWGKRQLSEGGRPWLLIDREHYDHKNKRHHDLEGGTDVIFDDRDTGRVGIQGAGKSERAVHYERFMAWGGPEKARRRNLRILYLEFERGNYEPIKMEWWA